MQRTLKQSSIVFIFVLILGAVVGALYFFFFWNAPTCTDGIQNQNEAGVDCGGSCSQMCTDQYVTTPLHVEEKGILPDTDTTADLYATVTNPNAAAVLKQAAYTFFVTDSRGQKTSVATGTFFLLPKETKSVLAIAIPHVVAAGEVVDFEISDETWMPLENYDGKPTINVYQKRYQEVSSGPGFAEAYGLVSNESQYDFREIGVNVILRNAEHVPVAVNKTVLNAVHAGEQRDFRLLWPNHFPGEVSEVETQIDINIFAEDAFMKQYFPGGQYQDLGPGNR